GGAAVLRGPDVHLVAVVEPERERREEARPVEVGRALVARVDDRVVYRIGERERLAAGQLLVHEDRHREAHGLRRRRERERGAERRDERDESAPAHHLSPLNAFGRRTLPRAPPNFTRWRSVDPHPGGYYSRVAAR